MFEVFIDGSVVQRTRPATLIWSGPTSFREIAPNRADVDAHLHKSLIARSREVLAPQLDFRAYEPVGRRLEIDGPASVRDYGRVAEAPHLAFVDITWRIRNLPHDLVERGIDSLSPFFRVEYVVDRRTSREIFRNTTNLGGIEDRNMRLFKEPGGPLLMAVEISCLDGAEPLILDLERESYGTGRRDDVPEVQHCFPAQ